MTSLIGHSPCDCSEMRKKGARVMVGLAILLAVALFAGLLAPYLYKEMRRGKADVGARIPLGPGDAHPGRRGNPAPGQPDAQADPWEPGSQKGGPPVRS